MTYLENKTALVTGASRGIGRAIALRLAAEGAEVIVNYKGRADAAASVVDEITASGGKARALQFDIADVDGTKAALESVAALDILVNNAGWAKFGPMTGVSGDEYDAIFNLNVRGLFFLTQVLVPKLRDGGRIVNISSGITQSNGGYGSVYAASKSAVEAFTRSWAVELGPRSITVNTVSPGMTETDLLDEVVPRDRQQGMAGDTPLGRLGRPRDIADVVAFLCSPDSGWITANNLLANGGVG